jgi:hypothetical protein
VTRKSSLDPKTELRQSRRHVATAFMGVARLWQSLYTTRDPHWETTVTVFT